MRPYLLILAAAASLQAQTDPSEILAKNCLSCHGATTQMAGLDLRTRDALLKGGGRGPAIIPGNANESLLLKAVLRQGDLKMPPGRTGLPVQDIETLKAWINAGAHLNAQAAAQASNWWSFQPLPRPAPSANIDSFLNAKLNKAGLQQNASSGKRTLIRRATFDLHGLPPTPEEIDAFVADTSANAYEKLIDKLLASPRYGERAARHWLDVVRYADTGGYETDVYFPNAWRYRDYVIRAFNANKPYDEFVKEQIAADEIWSTSLDLEGAYEMPQKNLDNLERRLGTALYTLGALPVENSFFGDQYRAEWQAEAVETTGAAFLGLTLGCARCHDHKFDPISQKDFYRMSAIFAGSEDREIPITSQMRIFEYTRHETRWVIVEQLKSKLLKLEAQIRKHKGGPTPAERDQKESLLRQIGEAYVKAPAPYDKANLLVHTDPVPDTYLLNRGEWNKPGEKVTPGLPAALGPAPEIREPDTNLFIPRRRRALAEWLASPQHPLTARVFVNRVWQSHFGRGIVTTPNDFGRQGDPPTHPELLDALASQFVASGWNVKALHKQILLSAAYQSSSAHNPQSHAKDPENNLYWRSNSRRLDAESIRDSILSVSGALNTKMFGPPVVTPVDEQEMDGVRDRSQWPITADPADHSRRSVYLFVKRSFRLPMLESFDAPDTSQSCARRESSTVAPQALALMNSEFSGAQAKLLAARLSKQATPEAKVTEAFRLALGRAPSAEELTKSTYYLQRAGPEALALLLFNMSEFLYVD